LLSGQEKMENLELKADGFNIGHIGWRYYNKIAKKAMEQEFSWSGFLVSVSIAFFVVIMASSLLGGIYNSIEKTQYREKAMKDNIYKLESTDGLSWENYLQPEHISMEKIEKVKAIQLI